MVMYRRWVLSSDVYCHFDVCYHNIICVIHLEVLEYNTIHVEVFEMQYHF